MIISIIPPWFWCMTNSHYLHVLIVLYNALTVWKSSDSQLPKNICAICFNDGSSKMMKNAFYFILKAIFVLKIFRFLSWIFGHVEKTVWLET